MIQEKEAKGSQEEDIRPFVKRIIHLLRYDKVWKHLDTGMIKTRHNCITVTIGFTPVIDGNGNVERHKDGRGIVIFFKHFFSRHIKAPTLDGREYNELVRELNAYLKRRYTKMMRGKNETDRILDKFSKDSILDELSRE
jgi:hypothetical protein